MNRYKGVIFDLDGTLLNTIEDLSDSVNEVLDFYGYPKHSYEEYRSIIGKGFRDLIEKSLPEDANNDTRIEEALKRFILTYDKNYRNRTVPYDGIEELLINLKDRNVKMAVNSNKRTDYTNNLINKFFPQIPFVGVYGERLGIPKKPDPTAALELAEAMGLNPKDIIYIGDSKTDILTGSNAGMGKAGVLWGFRGYDELFDSGADIIIREAKEINDLF